MEPTGRANARPMTGSAQSGTVSPLIRLKSLLWRRMSQHEVRSRAHCRIGIIYKSGNQRGLIVHLRADDNHGIRDNLSHKRRSVADTFGDEVCDRAIAFDASIVQLRNASFRAIDLVEPDPVESDRPAGLPQNQARTGDGSDRRLNGRHCQSRQVLVEAGISQCGAETAAQPASRASFKLSRQCREDVVASEQRIKSCDLIAPPPLNEPSFKQVEGCLRGDSSRGVCRNAPETFYRGATNRPGPVVQPPCERGKKERRRRGRCDGAESGLPQITVRVKQEQPRIVGVSKHELSLRLRKSKQTIRQGRVLPPPGEAGGLCNLAASAHDLVRGQRRKLRQDFAEFVVSATSASQLGAQAR